MADDIEDRLRQQLRQAAELAPQFHADPARPVPAAGDPRRPRWVLPMAIAAAVVLIIGVGAVINRQLFDGAGGSSASCAPVLTFHGRQYEPMDVVRIPKPGRDLGTATTCVDTASNGTPSPADRVGVVAASGISPSWAFLYDDQLWVADRQGRRPAAVRALQRPIRCLPAVSRLSGTVALLDGRSLDDSPPTAAPYTITLRVTGPQLSSLRADRFQAVLVPIQVTRSTHGAALIGRLTKASERDVSLTALVSCDGNTFRARRITLG